MSTSSLNNKINKVVSNMSTDDKVRYTHDLVIGLMDDVKSGKITQEEFEKRTEQEMASIVKPMDYQKYHEYFVDLHKDAIKIAIEAYKEMDRNHKMAALFGTEATQHYIEETINHEATKSVLREEMLYQAHPEAKAAELTKEDIKERKESMLPMFQCLKTIEQERAELLDPKIWEDLGGVPDVKPYSTVLMKKAKRVCADPSLLPDKFADSGIIAEE